jgi:hypothetical protein
MTTENPTARQPRFPIRIGAELRVEGKLVTGTTRNLSVGGVCVEIDRPLKEGALVQMVLFTVEEDVELEGQKGLELTGNVQWTAEADRGYAVGLKFGNLTAAQQASLQRALKVAGES